MVQAVEDAFKRIIYQQPRVENPVNMNNNLD